MRAIDRYRSIFCRSIDFLSIDRCFVDRSMFCRSIDIDRKNNKKQKRKVMIDSDRSIYQSMASIDALSRRGRNPIPRRRRRRRRRRRGRHHSSDAIDGRDGARLRACDRTRARARVRARWTTPMRVRARTRARRRTSDATNATGVARDVRRV